jgi:hypothetical protein
MIRDRFSGWLRRCVIGCSIAGLALVCSASPAVAQEAVQPGPDVTRIGVLGAAVVGGLVGGFAGAALATRLGTGSTDESPDEGRQPTATAETRQRTPETRTQHPEQTPHDQQVSPDRRQGNRETQPQQHGGGTDRQGQPDRQNR